MDENKSNIKWYKKISIDKTNVKNKILSCSLLWMGLGLAMIILVSYLTSIPYFRNGINKLFKHDSIWITTMVNIGLLIGIMFTINNKNINIIIPVFLYICFAFYEGIYINGMISIWYKNNHIQTLMLYMLIPAGIFLLMGLLSYANAIDFTKLMPFCGFIGVGLMILCFVFIFTNNQLAEKWFVFLSAALFVIWIGFDLQIIKRTEQSLNDVNLSKNELARLTFMFGFKLFIDFINLLMIVLRIMRD